MDATTHASHISAFHKTMKSQDPALILSTLASATPDTCEALTR